MFSPARAIVKNCKQYNGKHGCDWCEFAGETIDNGGPPTRYPPETRTAEKQVEYGLKAIQNGKDVKGVRTIHSWNSSLFQPSER